MKADRKERTARHEATEAKTETGQKPREAENKTDLEEMEATDLEANPEKMETNPEKMESEVEHWEIATEEAAVKSSGTMKKRHRVRHLAAERHEEPKELTRRNCDPGGSWLPPAGRCPVRARGTLGRGWWWYTRTGSHLIRKLLGTSGLKEGAVGAVGEQPPQRE
jgi:hypothetical protein